MPPAAGPSVCHRALAIGRDKPVPPDLQYRPRWAEDNPAPQDAAAHWAKGPPRARRVPVWIAFVGAGRHSARPAEETPAKWSWRPPKPARDSRARPTLWSEP